MLLLNKKATAQEMYDWGLVSRVIPHGQFKQQTRAMMAEMSQLPPKVCIFTIHKHLNFLYQLTVAAPKYLNLLNQRFLFRNGTPL